MLNEAILSQAAAEARGLAIDAIHACSSGHLGLPLGCAEIGAVLFADGGLRFHPDAPKWLNRDRLILSGGHGSMFLYAWLHLAGYDLPMEALKAFRQLGSATPGHPEYAHTPGVEATTGPLGQGIGNAVGYALSGKRAAAIFNTPSHCIFDHHVISLHGDGCLQEGLARESIAFAGHLHLDNLILIYDANRVTLDAMAEQTQSEDATAYFESQGWQIFSIDGHDLHAISEAMADAKNDDNGKPKVIIASTTIAKGIPEVEGTAAGHGEGGVKFAEAARQGLGLSEQRFYVSKDVRAHFSALAASSSRAFEAWNETFAAWQQENPELAAQLDACMNDAVPDDLLNRIPEFERRQSQATRVSGGVALQTLANAVPQLLTGSADLFGSTKNYIQNAGDFSATDFSARNIWFGIREHAMGAICNGLAYDGLFRPSCATFLVFADYLRGSIRLAALSNLPVVYIFTHDSVGVGEDGPTHQPVETIAGLRVIPNLDVIRPADAEETAAAFVAALQRKAGPTALILTRQNVPNLDGIPSEFRRQGTLQGGYIAKKEAGTLELILMATGSELQLALRAAEQLGEGIRVVSLPCFESFERQSAEVLDAVLPASCSKRVAIEAGVSSPWGKYVGLYGRTVCIDRFGMSAPAPQVMEELGITVEHIVSVANDLLRRV